MTTRRCLFDPHSENRRNQKKLVFKLKGDYFIEIQHHISVLIDIKRRNLKFEACLFCDCINHLQHPDVEKRRVDRIQKTYDVVHTVNNGDNGTNLTNVYNVADDYPVAEYLFLELFNLSPVKHTMEHLVDAHYVALPSQGNVYSLAPLAVPGGAHKLLLATLRRRVLSFRYASTNDSVRLKPLVRDVHFTCIPSGSEIISIDAFSRTQNGEDYVIGITLIKPGVDGGRSDAYLNTYSELDCELESAANIETSPAAVPGSSTTGITTPGLDNAAQNCSMLELGFVPYQLSHTTLPSGNETVWLLGGGDCRIHVLQEDSNLHCYSEVPTKTLFPDLADTLPSPPLWNDVRYQDPDIRVCAVGCECGYVQVTHSCVKDEECTVQAKWKLQLQGPVSCVRFFTLPNEMHWQPLRKQSVLHLIVVCALQPTQIFMNVCVNGLANGSELVGSASGDAVLCGTPADVDLDGSVEVLLGTYGRQLLVYKWISGNWELRATRTLPHPVHSIHYLDVTGDGARELLILTPRGLHVFQHHVEDVENRLEAFLQNLSAHLSSPSKQQIQSTKN